MLSWEKLNVNENKCQNKNVLINEHTTFESEIMYKKIWKNTKQNKSLSMKCYVYKMAMKN